MKVKEMIELIQQHHPHIGETEAIRILNRAKNDFCFKTEIVKDSFISTTVANQRYYTLDSKIINIKSVWLNDVEIPKAIGKPIIDDDTAETG